MTLDLNYHHLFYFWTCARSGGISAASRDLRLSQSALSSQLKHLEETVGKRLFERTRMGVELTTTGMLVFEHCERIFAHGAALSAALRGGAAGTSTTIRLGISSSLGRDTALAFIDRLAGIADSGMTVFVGSRDEVRDRLARRRLDVAVAAEDISIELGGSFRGSRVGRSRVGFFASPELAHGLHGFPRRGQEAPLLLRAGGHAIRREVDAFLAARGARPVVVAESEDADLLRTLARRGRGIVALNAEGARRDVEQGALVRVGPARTGLFNEIWVVTPARESLDPVLAEAFARMRRP